MRLKREIREGVNHLMKGVTHLMKGLPPPWRGEKGVGVDAHLWAAPPFSYIRWHLVLSSVRHLVHSIRYLVAPPIRKTLSEALPKLLATNTWRSGGGGGGVPTDPNFLCPAGPKAWRTSRNHTCDRVRNRTVRVTEYGGATGCGALYTIFSSSSERLRRLCTSSSSLHRQCLCGNENLASSLRGLVNRCFHLVDDLG
jgi:hypothetical protein